MNLQPYDCKVKHSKPTKPCTFTHTHIQNYTCIMGSTGQFVRALDRLSCSNIQSFCILSWNTDAANFALHLFRTSKYSTTPLLVSGRNQLRLNLKRDGICHVWKYPRHTICYDSISLHFLSSLRVEAQSKEYLNIHFIQGLVPAAQEKCHMNMTDTRPGQVNWPHVSGT